MGYDLLNGCCQYPWVTSGELYRVLIEAPSMQASIGLNRLICARVLLVGMIPWFTIGI